MRLSNQAVSRLQLPADKSELIVFDEALPGFGIRLLRSGRKSWIAQYRVGRKQRRISMGAVGKVTAEQARAKAKSLLAQVQLGTDPQDVRSTERDRGAVTLGVASVKYLQRAQARMRPRSYEEVKRHFDRHWAPLNSDPIHKIDRARIAVRLNEIRDESGPVAANRARSSLSAFFAWAISEGITDTNPVTGTNKSAERSRERVLTDPEIVKVWNACADDDHGRIVRQLILTGQRREEVGGARESEIDREKAVWILPGDRTKNGLWHEVPLSDAALETWPARGARGTRDLLFGESDGRPFSGWSRCKERLDERSGVADWTLHDIRRTVATGMGELGVQPHIVEVVLNHVSGARRGVAGTYNRARYSKEKREAMLLWAAHVLALAAGKKSNIVALAKA